MGTFVEHRERLNVNYHTPLAKFAGKKASSKYTQKSFTGSRNHRW